MQASIIIPVLTLIALVVKSIFGIEIGEETIEQIADGIVTLGLGVITVIGVVKSHQKKEEK